MRLELDRTRHLPKFRRDRFFRARLQQSRDLHGQSRTAGNNMATRDELQRGAPQRFDIDAFVRVETMVLVSEQHSDEAWIDVLCRRREAPAPVLHRESAE